TGFIGETERGPVRPTLITGLEEYRRVFGSYGWTKDGKSGAERSNSVMRHALEGFFVNGGKRAFVARVIADDAKYAGCVIVGAPPTAAAVEKAAKEADTAAKDAETAAQQAHEKAAQQREAADKAAKDVETAAKDAKDADDELEKAKEQHAD